MRKRFLVLMLAALTGAAFLVPVSGASEEGHSLRSTNTASPSSVHCVDTGSRIVAAYVPQDTKRNKRFFRQKVAAVNALLDDVLEQDLRWACWNGKPRVRRLHITYNERIASPIANIRRSIQLVGWDRLDRTLLIFQRFRGDNANGFAGIHTNPEPPGWPDESPIAAINKGSFGWVDVLGHEIVGALGAQESCYGCDLLRHPEHWYDSSFDPNNESLECWYRVHGPEWCNIAFSPFLTRHPDQPCEWRQETPHALPECVAPEPSPTPTPTETPEPAP